MGKTLAHYEGSDSYEDYSLGYLFECNQRPCKIKL